MTMCTFTGQSYFSLAALSKKRPIPAALFQAFGSGYFLNGILELVSETSGVATGDALESHGPKDLTRLANGANWCSEI